MSRAVVSLLAVCAFSGCALRQGRTDAPAPCSSNNQCDPSYVCFLGECRGSSASLSQVVVEIRPPNDSPLGVLQRANIDLHASAVVNFQLQPLLDVKGVVVEAGDAGFGLDTGDAGTVAGAGTPALPGATLTFTDHAPAIPDRVHKITTRSDATGTFGARLPVATWDLVVQAADSTGLPPFSALEAVQGAGVSLGLRVPSVQLQTVAGSIAAGGVPISGASVSAIDRTGEPLAVPVTSVDGGFVLVLPLGPPPFRLQIGPGDSDGGVAAALGDPLPSFLPFGPPNASEFSTAALIVKDLGALPVGAVLQGTVTASTSGLPIPAARVSAVSTDGNGWIISRSTVAGADGSFSLQVRAGHYLVEAAPDAAADQPAASGEIEVTVVPGGPALHIACNPKTRAFGLLVLPGNGNNKAVGEGYQVTATRLPDRVISSRAAFTTATDSAGIFHLVGDAGRYRLEIVPPHAASLPRKTVQLQLESAAGEISLPAIQISPPVVVYGTVHGQAPGGSDAPVANATVDFFAIDASGKATVMLGTGVTDASGHYSVVLPDVPQPGLVP